MVTILGNALTRPGLGRSRLFRNSGEGGHRLAMAG